MLLLATLGPAQAAGPTCDRPFTLALHEHGLLYDSRTGEGIDQDLAEALVRRSGCTISISVMPRARIWQLIESGALDFGTSGISNPAREQFAAFAWTFSNPYQLLLRKDAGAASLAEFARNPALKLGVVRSFRYSASANTLVDKLDAEGRVAQASNLAALYPALLENRVQAMIVEPFDEPALQSQQLRSITLTLAFDDPPVPHGLIMSRKSLSPTQQQAWRALVDGLRADGTIERILAKHLKPETARALVRF